MKILWVKAGGLVPLDFGGRIRSFHILRELARSHEITLFTFYAEQPDDRHCELSKVFSRVECRPLKLPAPRSFGEAALYARSLFSLQPHSILKYCKRAVERDLRRLVREQRFDVCVCDFAVAGGVIPWEQPLRKILFTHNVEAQIWRRHFDTARNPVWKAVCLREYLTMKRAETRYLRLADHVLTVSEADRLVFGRRLSAEKLTVIPTGVDLDFFAPTNAAAKPNSLVFTGAMDWLANEDGMAYFIAEIMPWIHQEMPEVTLTIVGRSPSARLRELAADAPGVCVTGRVEDIRPYVAEAALYIVPLRVGGGTRLKIFEAMAMGKAIISTSIGAEGLPVENNKQIVLADSKEDFAQRVIELLRNPVRRSQLEKAGRLLVESEYGWPAVARRFEQVLLKAEALP
jgi:polysaccharide biosynthesis protein PslH